MSDLADAISRAILEEAGVDQEQSLDIDAHLALIASSASAEGEARTVLHRAVASARAAGASWALIGSELRMSRQAAQQRFGDAARVQHEGDSERWLGPVTAFDEMAELDLAGREGWHTVEAGMLTHRMVRGDTQWEHRRILWKASLAGESANGWEVGCRAFPWIYLVRDTGIPAQAPGQ